MPTPIYFRSQEQGLAVDGDVADVAEELQQGGPVRLTTTDGSVIFVNWSNVLYIEESHGPAAA